MLKEPVLVSGESLHSWKHFKTVDNIARLQKNVGTIQIKNLLGLECYVID